MGIRAKHEDFRFATGERAPRWLSLKCEPRALRRCGSEYSIPQSKERKKTTVLVVFFFV